MTEDKKIEEMAKVMNECCNRYDEQGNHLGNKCFDCECWCDTNHICCSYNSKEAMALYNAGYRKSSDVAREIFEEIDERLDDITIVMGVLDSLRTFHKTIEKVTEEVDKLKRKYTEGENE